MAKRDRSKPTASTLMFTNWQLIAHKPAFQNEVVRIRKKWKIPEDGYEDWKEANRWSFSTHDGFEEEVKQTFSRFYNDPNWIYFIIFHILLNETPAGLKPLDDIGFNDPVIKKIDKNNNKIKNPGASPQGMECSMTLG